MAKRRNGLWTQVILNTASGHFVHTQNIPPFVEPPDVLIWGARVFTRKGLANGGTPLDEGVEVYEEVWAYALVNHPGVPLPAQVHSPENVVDIPGDVAPTYLQLSPENEMRAAHAPTVTPEGGEGPDMETRIVDDECHVISCPALPWPFATQEKLELWCEFHQLPVPGEPWLARFEPIGMTPGEMPEGEITITPKVAQVNKIPERAHAEPSPIHGDVIQQPPGHKPSIGDAPLPVDGTNAAQAGEAVADGVAAAVAEAACDPVDTPESWGDSPENGETTPDPMVTKVPGIPYDVRWAPPADVGYPVYRGGQHPGGKPDAPPEGFNEGSPQLFEPISAMGPNGLTFHGPIGYEPMVHADPDLKADDVVRVEIPQDWPEGTVTTTYDPEAAYLERINEQPRGLTDWEARTLAMAYAARKHSGPKPLPWPFQCMEELIAWCDQHGLPYPEGTYTTIPPDHYSNKG